MKFQIDLKKIEESKGFEFPAELVEKWCEKFDKEIRTMANRISREDSLKNLQK